MYDNGIESLKRTNKSTLIVSNGDGIESQNDRPSSKSGVLSKRIGRGMYQRMTMLVNFPFLIILYFLTMIQQIFSGNIPSLRNFRMEEDRKVFEEVPKIQRRLKSDINVVSTEQKVLGNQIDDLKERIAKLEERKTKRILLAQKYAEVVKED